MAKENELDVGAGIIDGEYTIKYAFLSRMKSDLEYYFGSGGNNPKHLYHGSIEQHIKETNKLLNSIPESARPEWLTNQDINVYTSKAKKAASLEQVQCDESSPNIAFQNILSTIQKEPKLGPITKDLAQSLNELSEYVLTSDNHIEVAKAIGSLPATKLYQGKPIENYLDTLKCEQRPKVGRSEGVDFQQAR